MTARHPLRTYDHRLVQLVLDTGDASIATRLGVLLTAVRNRGIPAVSAHRRRPIFPGSWRGRRDQKETHVKEIHLEMRHLKENGGQPR